MSNARGVWKKLPLDSGPVRPAQGGKTARDCSSPKYLQGLLKGWVHCVLLDASLALALGGSVRQQIGLHVPGSQTQTGQVKLSGRPAGGERYVYAVRCGIAH